MSKKEDDPMEGIDLNNPVMRLLRVQLPWGAHCAAADYHLFANCGRHVGGHYASTSGRDAPTTQPGPHTGK
eukprot:365059-Chlamydomonas_euryale.AAC.12